MVLSTPSEHWSRGTETLQQKLYFLAYPFSVVHTEFRPRGSRHSSARLPALEFSNATFRLPPNFRRRTAPGNACNKRPVVLGTFQSFPCPVCPFFSLVKVWMWSCMSFSPSLSHRTSVSSELPPLTKKDRSRLLVSFLHASWRGSREQTCHRLPDIAVSRLRFKRALLKCACHLWACTYNQAPLERYIFYVYGKKLSHPRREICTFQ